MTESSEAKVLEVLGRHSEEMCRSAYMEEAPSSEARHCLLGWMAVDAGISLPSSEYRTHVIGMTGTLAFADQLQSFYGLSMKQLKMLQFANDDSPDIPTLARKIAEALEQAEENGG